MIGVACGKDNAEVNWKREEEEPNNPENGIDASNIKGSVGSISS